MELKVWFDGLPRIVCGVNDKTTCQDIVFALAQATGKTGRFTLIERWRNNDRLLAPAEVVMKWGEHSSDVQYILQCAAIDPKNAKTPTQGTHDAETLPKTSISPQDDTPTAPPPYRNPPSPGKPPTKSPGKELPPYRLPPPPNPPLMNVPEQPIGIEASLVTEAQEPKDPSHEYKSLIHLINCQREKLTAQQAELTQHDAEIKYWETKARIQGRNMEAIAKEMTRLEILSLQNDAQVLALKEVEVENDSIVADAERLRQETDALRKVLSHCDQELSTCRSKIRLLEESLASAEVERLRQEVASTCEETDTICGVVGSLEVEASSLASSLGVKRAEMEELVSAMKEANLESLGMGEEESLFRSRRRIRGSARQLKDAAPTTKNPIGVWV